MALTDNLVSYYCLDGVGTDLKKTLDLVPTGATYTTGKIRNCASFASGSDNMKSSSGAVLGLASGFSVQAWIKTSASGITQAIVNRDYCPGATYRDFQFRISTGNVLECIRFSAGDNPIFMYSGVTVTDGNWHHVVWTWDTSAGGIVYIDSISRGTSGTKTTNQNTASTNIIGNYDIGFANVFVGLIDEVGIWNRALSSAEVTALYNSGNGYPFVWPVTTDLPDISNQTPNFGTSADVDRATFIEIMKVADIEAIIRLRLKKRKVVSGVNVYDTDWTDITEYLTIDGCGDLSSSIDENEYISGTVKSDYVSLIFDNITRKFTKRDNPESLWYDPVTTYYINESKVELTFGYRVGNYQYFRDYAHFSGKIVGDNIRYDANNNNVTIGVRSLLEDLKKVNVNDYIPLSAKTDYDYLSISDLIISNLSINEYTFKANFPKANPIYSAVSENNYNLYELMEKTANDTGSVFGVKRNGDVFLSYIGTPYYISNTGSFLTSTAYSYYNFDESTITSHILDPIHNSTITVGSLAAVYSTLTTGRFGSGRKFYTSREVTNVTIAGTNTVTGDNYSIDVLFRIGEYHPVPANNPLFTSMNYSASDTNTTKEIPYTVTVSSNQVQFNFFNTCYLETSKNSMFMSLNDSTTYVNYTNGTYSIGEGAWNYLSVQKSYVGSLTVSNKAYINGNYLGEAKTTVFSSTANGVIQLILGSYALFNETKFSPYSYIELDSMRVMQTISTYEEIQQNTARIFRNDFNQSSISIYDFYNYGRNKNIYDMRSYEDGISKIYNKVAIKNYEEKKDYSYQCAFTFNHAPSMPSYFVLYRDGTYDNKLYRFTNSLDLKSIFDTSLDGNFLVEYTGNTFSIKANISDYEASKLAFGFTSQEINTTTVAFSINMFSITCSPQYLGYYYGHNQVYISSTICHHTRYLCFDKVKTVSDYTYIDTLSTYEYGEKVYGIDAKTYKNNSSSILENIATSFLENRAYPKERIKISTRFLEGDLELFDRVTLNWRPDTDSPNVYDDTDYTDDAPTEVGNITWTSKDFWIIGYRHSWSSNETEYTLREI